MANVGALREAVRTSNISLVKRLVKGGVCVDERLWYGRTLLQECVTLSDEDMVKSLIEYGEADVNAQNDDGKTALHIASRAGSLNIVSLLLEAGARTDTQCLDGTTSLHLAMWKNKSQVVARLIKAGANPNLQDQDHWTPLHWGVQSRNLDLVKLLVENGANMDIVNKSLLTPFTLSVEICCFPIAKYMLFMGAGVRTINDTKKTPKSIISLLLRPEVVMREEVDVPKFVLLLVKNGYNLWNDAELLSSKVMANKECEKIRQLLLSQISNPHKLLDLCRHKLWDILHHKHARGKFLNMVCSLQIPTHLQNFLLTQAELRLQQLARSSSYTSNQSCIDLSSGSDLKKTGIIRLKKTSSLITAGKEMARLEQDHPSTSKCNNHVDTLPKKKAPTRIVFNSPPQTVEDTSLIDCHRKTSFLLPQMNSNQNMSRTSSSKASSLNDIQAKQCQKESVKPETLSIPSKDAGNKIPPMDKVRKLCRFNFDMMPVNSDSNRVERCAKKRRAWKSEDSVRT